MFWQVASYLFTAVSVLAARTLVVLDRLERIDLRLGTGKKSLPWLSVVAVPAIALSVAAMETESEGSHGWAARFGTVKLIGGFTAYHTCLGVTVVLLCHLPWLFVPVRTWGEAIQLERGIAAIILLLFALEDIGFYQGIHAPTTYFDGCGDDGVRFFGDCYRSLRDGSIEAPVAAFAPLVAATLLVGADASIFAIVGTTSFVSLLLIVGPTGSAVRWAYATRESYATTAPGFETRGKIINDLHDLEQTQGIDGLRLLMEAWRPIPDLYRRERGTTSPLLPRSERFQHLGDDGARAAVC